MRVALVYDLRDDYRALGLSEEEIAVLRSEAEAIYATDRKEVWRETSGAPRTAFAAHTYNEAFRLLGNHPRLIHPVEQVFGEQLYMHEYKINAKAAGDLHVPAYARTFGLRTRITMAVIGLRFVPKLQINVSSMSTQMAARLHSRA